MLSLSDSPFCRLTWQPKAVARIVNELNTLNKRRCSGWKRGRKKEERKGGLDLERFKD